MLPIERRRQIMKWLEEEKSISIKELSERLQISEMTVYRDIKPLLEKEDIYKTPGGIAVRVKTDPGGEHCVYCHKAIGNDRLSVRLFQRSSQVETACCAHCGMLRYLQIGDQVEQVVGTDFLLGTTVNVATSYLLFDSDLPIRCCSPSILVFEKKSNAKRFQNGFNGKLYSFWEALQQVRSSMTTTCSSCPCPHDMS